MSISDNLISLYNFNWNARDSSWGDFHGTITWAVLATDRFNNANSAYSFDWVDDKISIASTSAFFWNDFTVSMWINPWTQAWALRTLFDYWHADLCNWVIQSESATTTKKYYLSYHNWTTFQWGWASNWVVLTTWVWQHVVWVKSWTSIIWYKDNTVNWSFTWTWSISNVAKPLAIWNWVTSWVRAFNWIIGEVRFWNRALSVTEITSLYNATKWNHSILSTGEYLTHSVSNLGIDSTGLSLLLNMNGNARDGSGNHYHGTVTGATLTTDQLGNANSSYLFNGTSNYISLWDVLDAWLTNFSYSVWFKTAVAWWLKWVFWKSRAGGWSRYSFLFETWLLYSLLSIGTTLKSITISETPYVDWNWHLFTATINRTWNHILYIDWVQRWQIDISTLSATDIQSSDLCGIWAYLNSSWNAFTQWFFNGSIADVRMYSRELSALEVLQLYNTWLGKVSRIKGKTYSKWFNTNTPPTTPIKMSQKKGSLISTSLITL
jgi:hypothetical protein